MPEVPVAAENTVAPAAPRSRALLIGGTLTGIAITVLTVALTLNQPSRVRAASISSTPTSGQKRPSAPIPAAQPASVSENRFDQGRTAVDAYRHGDVAGAIAQLTRLVDANPHDAAALNNLGQALVRAKRASDAIPYFSRAVELSPTTWAYRFNRARAHAELESWSQAIADYRQAAVLFPEDYATHFNLAKALQASGDIAGAIDVYQKAVALAPGQPDFLLSLAAVQEQAHRAGDAADTYRKYLELEPGSPDAEKIRDRIARLTS